MQPVCYSGVKQFTDERTSSMGYGLIYALMNAGIVVIGEISARFRPAVQSAIDATRAAATNPAATAPSDPGLYAWFAANVGSGIQAVNWICTGIVAVVLVGFR